MAGDLQSHLVFSQHDVWLKGISCYQGLENVSYCLTNVLVKDVVCYIGAFIWKGLTFIRVLLSDAVLKKFQ